MTKAARKLVASGFCHFATSSKLFFLLNREEANGEEAYEEGAIIEPYPVLMGVSPGLRPRQLERGEAPSLW